MPLTDFQEQSRDAWVRAIQSVSGPTPPTSMVWTDHFDIEKVLKRFLGRNKNHTHLPTGGGHDFWSVEFSEEEDCLYFATSDRGGCLMKPEKLLLEYISESPAESFLYLEGLPIKPALHAGARGSEEVVDLGGGKYIDRTHWDQNTYGHDNEEPLPEYARLVTRFLRGNFMIVCKGSLWNGSPHTYSGEHDRMTVQQIRSVIINGL